MDIEKEKEWGYEYFIIHDEIPSFMDTMDDKEHSMDNYYEILNQLVGEYLENVK